MPKILSSRPLALGIPDEHIFVNFQDFFFFFFWVEILEISRGSSVALIAVLVWNYDVPLCLIININIQE